MEQLKVFTVDFDPMWPVGCALVILAETQEQATQIAKDTIKHTNEFTVTEHPQKPGVVVYLSGDY